VCSIIADTSRSGNTTSESSAAVSSAASSQTTAPPAVGSAKATATATATVSAPGIDSTTPLPPSQCNKFPAGVFVAGFFPGILIGAFAMLAWVICTGRHRKPSSRNSVGSSLYKHKPVISDPIPLGVGGARTDFLRRTTTRARSMFSARSSPRLGAGHWKMPTPPEPNNVPANPAGLPITPERRVAHEPSTESIQVYSPPSALRPPSAAVAPLRAMAAQRNHGATSMGSPFKTPPNNNLVGNNMTYHGATMADQVETLTPARYDGGQSTRRPRDGVASDSRPTTTFTEMLHEINFPDPIGGGPPAVPKVPRGYDSTSRI